MRSTTTEAKRTIFDLLEDPIDHVWEYLCGNINFQKLTITMSKFHSIDMLTWLQEHICIVKQNGMYREESCKYTMFMVF